MDDLLGLALNRGGARHTASIDDSEGCSSADNSQTCHLKSARGRGGSYLR